MIMDAFHSIKPVFGRSKRVSTQGSGLFSTSDVTRSDADSWWLATERHSAKKRSIRTAV